MEGLKGGVAMAEIARREGISERGLRKYVRNLIARRAPEATGEFIAVQMSRLNEALLMSFGAMSAPSCHPRAIPGASPGRDPAPWREPARPIANCDARRRGCPRSRA